jgi:hypothetical protein
VVFADTKKPATELAGYLVTFESVTEPVSATGLVRDDATFEMSTYGQADGAVPGKHRVVITAPVPTGDGPIIPWLIDRKHGAFESSGLSIEVTAPLDNVVFEVERPGRKLERPPSDP